MTRSFEYQVGNFICKDLKKTVLHAFELIKESEVGRDWPLFDRGNGEIIFMIESAPFSWGFEGSHENTNSWMDVSILYKNSVPTKEELKIMKKIIDESSAEPKIKIYSLKCIYAQKSAKV